MFCAPLNYICCRSSHYRSRCCTCSCPCSLYYLRPRCKCHFPIHLSSIHICHRYNQGHHILPSFRLLLQIRLECNRCLGHTVRSTKEEDWSVRLQRLIVRIVSQVQFLTLSHCWLVGAWEGDWEGDWEGLWPSPLHALLAHAQFLQEEQCICSQTDCISFKEPFRWEQQDIIPSYKIESKHWRLDFHFILTGIQRQIWEDTYHTADVPLITVCRNLAGNVIWTVFVMVGSSWVSTTVFITTPIALVILTTECRANTTLRCLLHVS